MPIVDVASTVNALIACHTKWAEVVAKYGLFESTAKDE